LQPARRTDKEGILELVTAQSKTVTASYFKMVHLPQKNHSRIILSSWEGNRGHSISLLDELRKKVLKISQPTTGIDAKQICGQLHKFW